jgi:molybdopterin converting factor subunit 1
MNQTVRVRLFAVFRDAFGADTIDVNIPCNATLKHLRDQIALLNPNLHALLSRTQIAVNNELASDDATVQASDELALLPPVSGG